MKVSFKNLLNEGFTNLFPGDSDKRIEYADEVFNMLVNSYKNIGGLKGKGFNSPSEMIKEIQMWKLSFVQGELVAVVMYKDRAGRKLVALGSNNSPTGKNKLKEILKVEFSRSYAEISGPLLKFMERTLPTELKRWTISTDKVEKILNKKIKIIDDFYYTRTINNETIKKVLIGTVKKLY